MKASSNSTQNGHAVIDVGNWVELQEKLETKPHLALDEAIDRSLAELETRFAQYVTVNSVKRSVGRRS